MTKRNHKIPSILLLIMSLTCLSYIDQKDYCSFIIIPDTQYYSFSHPEIFHKQMDWIVKNKNLLNIKYVLHMGDITDENQDYEWKVASSCFKTLENAGIPYSIVYGDNDIKNPDSHQVRYDGTRHTELLNKYFPVSRFDKPGSWWKGGFFKSGKIDNYYCLFEYGGTKFMIMNLEITPRDAVISWANQIISNNISRKVIIVTHDFIDPEGNRLDDLGSFGMDGMDNKGNPRGNNANTLYKKLIKDNPNVLLILCGHKSGEFEKALKIKTSENSEEKRIAFEILTDYQNERLNGTGDKCGNGLLRVMQFHPLEKKIILTRVNTLTGKEEGEIITLSLE
jgi:hypothetical protein